MEKDILIIGGGVVGCAVARLLSAYEGKIALIERGSDVAEGASKANSGIVHAGFDAKPGSLKAKLNVEGSRMYEGLCREVQAPYGNPGALVLAFSEEERKTVNELYQQGVANGVEGLEIIEREKILELEPRTNPDVVCALWAKTSGLTSPYELTCALADHAAVNGVEFMLETEAQDVKKEAEGFTVVTNKGDIHCRILVNCAGVSSAKLHNMLSEKKLEIIPRKGEYYLLDHAQVPMFTMTMFQTPTKMGKGVLVSPTAHGNLLLGPTAEDIEDPLDTATTGAALKLVNEAVRKTWPKENLRTCVTTFAGIRAHEKNGDFVIGATEGAKGAYEAVGVESPGLTAAPAIAKMMAEQIADENGLTKKADWKPAPQRRKPFSSMTLEERAEAYAQNPEYGTLVCRCEQVTEAEIREAIRRPVGARTIDAIKRRTRAGMGRCQGGFCSPRVLEILTEELGIAPTEVTKCGGKSTLLVGSIAQAARKENA
ncbi:MAG: NAD(P)/FAD-dependent oxidoreductase [Eubacteriales bacterium]|nr:NAD(P)/FAD-dependent oxidoreductase [Eubacteriales bacterium]